MRAAPARRESTGRDLRGCQRVVGVGVGWGRVGWEPLGLLGGAGALTPVQAISGRHDGLREGRNSVLRKRVGRWTSQLSRRREELNPRSLVASWPSPSRPPKHQPQTSPPPATHHLCDPHASAGGDSKSLLRLGTPTVPASGSWTLLHSSSLPNANALNLQPSTFNHRTPQHRSPETTRWDC